MDPVYQYVISLLLSWVFLSAAWHKLRHADHFQAILDSYRLLPFPARAFHALALGLGEAAIGVGILLGNVRSTATLAAITVLTVYALAISFNLVRGRREIDCGCAGPLHSQPISWHLVARNVMLVALVATILFGEAERTLGWIDWLTTVFAGAAAIMIYRGAGVLLEIQLKLNEMRMRI